MRSCSLFKIYRHAAGVIVFLLGIAGHSLLSSASDLSRGDREQISLGKRLFEDVSLSRDGKTACKSCHDPEHAYSDPHPKSIGTDGRVGTRNAPSLIGIGDDAEFLWDGRRNRLEDTVTDPFTNPAELGLGSTDELTARLNGSRTWKERFQAAFPCAGGKISIDQIRTALAAFVRSLKTGTSAFDSALANKKALSPEAERGRVLFAGVAGCTECHSIEGNPARFSDGKYHHSGVEQSNPERVPDLAKTIVQENLDAPAIGPKVLTNADWSSLGRFVVTHQPSDIGAFRTPSLRNVAHSAPYMHDGSIATLSEAVDREIYYRGFSEGHPVNLTSAERRAIDSFLETFTDEEKK